ncbi:phage tail domain-containing protein [Streptococcus suis]|uniref:Phage protein n=1 Tax=Streptococcus suis TaxID=1307 RepID=A0A123T7F4_STRSU|nr:phage tail domain-containing protein [Streptococcus suis]NQH51402.1 phage tail protein [Streptococcus suis]CYU97996.1 phage protein [Streptococcus suis]
MLKSLLDGSFPDSLKCCLATRPVIPSPEMEYEDISIPGRDGSLTRELGYKNIPIECEYNMLEEVNIKSLVRTVKGFFVGKKTLRFSDDDVYYKIKKIQFSDIENEVAEYGLFRVTFECDPFQYALNSSVSLVNGQSFQNMGTYRSKPYLKVFGSGTLTVNGKSIILRDVGDYIELDSDLQNAYRGNVDMNRNMVGEFPEFVPGTNRVSWSGNITKIICEGRWRYL